MARTSQERKLEVAQSYSNPERLLNKIANLKQPSAAPLATQDSILARSKKTAQKRAIRYSQALHNMT